MAGRRRFRLSLFRSRGGGRGGGQRGGQLAGRSVCRVQLQAPVQVRSRVREVALERAGLAQIEVSQIAGGVERDRVTEEVLRLLHIVPDRVQYAYFVQGHRALSVVRRHAERPIEGGIGAG